MMAVFLSLNNKQLERVRALSRVEDLPETSSASEEDAPSHQLRKLKVEDKIDMRMERLSAILKQTEEEEVNNNTSIASE